MSLYSADRFFFVCEYVKLLVSLGKLCNIIVSCLTVYSFDGILVFGLLFICTCAYLKKVPRLNSWLLSEKKGVWGVFYKGRLNNNNSLFILFFDSLIWRNNGQHVHMHTQCVLGSHNYIIWPKCLLQPIQIQANSNSPWNLHVIYRKTDLIPLNKYLNIYTYNTYRYIHTSIHPYIHTDTLRHTNTNVVL